MITRKFTVGLTGGIGSGKTTASNFFAELGVSIIDTDVIAHDLCKPNGIAISSIRTHFGDDFIQADGAMDRTKMRELVFQDSEAKQQLETILHPLIGQQTKVLAEQSSGVYTILVIPLLIESKLWMNQLDRILVIECEKETQIQRVIERNHFSREQVLQIIMTQKSREERRLFANDVIDTEQDFDHIQQQVKQLHHQYLNLLASMQKN